MDFNDSQRKAIEHHKGPMMVLAGPGSGKTMVITHRIKHLIESYGVNPSKILVITFTKAATIEMKSRFESLMGGVKVPVRFGTFHSIFFMILKQAYGYDVSNILTEDQKKKVLDEIITKLSLDIEDKNDFSEGIQKEISLIKNERISLEHYYSVNCSDEIFRNIFEEYQSALSRYRKIDFDDMLFYCYELLTKRPDILKLWQQAFEYILIDEFQDINQLQYDTIRLLAIPNNNLFIVGDDDQSIYQFRGAKPDIMLNFPGDYKNAKKVLLDTNYRCSETIIAGAMRVIGHNKTRYQKKIKAFHEKGHKIRIQEFQNLTEENNEIVSQIKILAGTSMSIAYHEVAVLFRTKTQARMLVGKLMEHNIPFEMKEMLPNIYEHWIAKDLITYIKIACGNMDRSLFLRIINRPKRYISREVFDTPEVKFQQLYLYFDDKKWMLERIEQLEDDLRIVKNMKPYAAINYITKGIGYNDFVKEYAEFRRVKPEEWLEVIDEIKEASKPFESFEEWFSYINDYEEECKKQSKEQKNSKKGVQLMTMHGSKGLEFQVVFLMDANEKITPHRKAVLEKDIEEERRMFYVAMTRAKSQLNIYYVKERFNKEYKPSRFINELLNEQCHL